MSRISLIRRCTLVLTGALLAAAPAVAEPKVELTLDRAVDLALENSLDLRAARLDTQIQTTGLRSELARFGRSLNTGLSYQSDRSPSTSSLEGVRTATSNRQSLSVGLAQRLWTGGSLGGQFSASRYYNNAAYFTVNPVYSSGLELNLTQPLLRGRGQVNRIGVELARNGIEGGRVALAGQVRDLRVVVGQAYWNQFAAIAGLEVARQLRGGAGRVLDLAQAQVEMGTGTRNSVLQAEVALARREEEIVVAEGSLQAAQDRLKAACGIDQAPDGWSTEVVLVDTPRVAPFTAGLEEGIDRALAASVAYQQALLTARNLDLQLALARDTVRPQVDLSGTVGVTGVGKSSADNLEELGKADSRSWRGGVSLTVPLGDSPSDAALQQRLLEQQRGNLNLDDLRLQLVQRVRDQHRQIGIALRRTEVAQATVGLAERNVADQEARLALGLATVKEVLDAQDELASARASHLGAVLDYARALLVWEQLTGP